MVEVFKTNVQTKKLADKLLTQLFILFPNIKINFYLEDSDKILRIQARKTVVNQIIEQVNQSGFLCEILQ
jgi:hypothetical protein